MELLAYIHEDFLYVNQSADQAIGADPDVSLQAWLTKLTTKSTQLSLNVILASTTILIGLGSTLSALAETAPSSNVRYVQSLLAKNGFDPGAIDGVAGASTKNAIIRAQQSMGLTADGVAGSRTIAALEDGGSVTTVTTKVEVKEPSAPVSSAVMNLQKLLADRGFYNGVVDGLMGSQTRAAIIAAQKNYNLVPDGVAGSRTLAALEADVSNKTSVTNISAMTSTTKSAEVSNLQELLSKRGFYNGAVDGIMGSQTRLAIVAAQKNYGLVTDGVAGSQTLSALERGGSNVSIADRNRESIAKTSTEAKKASDQDVLALQDLLSRRGFYNGAIDGFKGSQTIAAIASAQNAYGLTPDGIAGSQTIAALQKNVRSAVTVKPTTTNNSSANQAASQVVNQVVKVAASSVNEGGVANLQNLLSDRGFYKGPVTGVLGSQTQAAIVTAQRAYGLPADGIAGAQTMAALEAGRVITNRQPIPAKPATSTVRVEPKATVTPQPETQIRVQAAATPSVAAIPTPQNQPKPQETVKPQLPTATPTTTPPQTTAIIPQVLELQNLLVKRGFYNGKPDGALSGETRNAIVRAQNFYTISPADGAPSNKLIDSLSKDTFISEGN